MTNITVSLVCDLFCIGLSVVFLWSTLIVLVGLIRPARRHPKANGKLKFAVLVCARNEESVIRLPVKSVLLSKYPAECREVIVLADNCTDRTASVAREAGAPSWSASFIALNQPSEQMLSASKTATASHLRSEDSLRSPHASTSPLP